MRIIHTGDWHIGQLFYEYDRELEHRAFFEWLRDQIERYEVKVLLIAGDVFDSANPSAMAQRMFYEFLDSLDRFDVQVIVTAGNHDSAARLEAPIPILEGRNVVVRGVVSHDEQGEIDFDKFLIPIRDGGEVKGWCMAVPYLRRGDYPTVVVEMETAEAEMENGEVKVENEEAEADKPTNPQTDKPTTPEPTDVHAEGVRRMYAKLSERANELRGVGEFVIAMGHLHISGGEISDTERAVVGGLECVGVDIFGDGISYTALGHLHKAQRVGGRDDVRYAGSPLPMSFAERNYNHGVTLIDVEEGELKSVEHLSFEPPIRLMSVPRAGGYGMWEEVEAELRELPIGEIDDRSPFLEVKVLLDSPMPSLRYDIENELKDKSVRLVLVGTDYRNVENRTRSIINYDDMKKISPIAMAKEFYGKRYGEEMPKELEDLLNELVEDLG